jgi:hypothetical protein
VQVGIGFFQGRNVIFHILVFGFPYGEGSQVRGIGEKQKGVHGSTQKGLLESCMNLINVSFWIKGDRKAVIGWVGPHKKNIMKEWYHLQLAQREESIEIGPK